LVLEKQHSIDTEEEKKKNKHTQQIGEGDEKETKRTRKIMP